MVSWLPLLCRGAERGLKGIAYPRLVKMVLSATLTQDPGELAQLDLHHPLFLTTGLTRYRFPEKLESYKVVHLHNFAGFLLQHWLVPSLLNCFWCVTFCRIFLPAEV